MLLINDLPEELLKKILSFLTIREKFRCERVCRHWQRNVFDTIHSLAFENFDDVFQDHHHKHKISKEDVLPLTVNGNTVVMKNIISKCGSHLRTFRGLVDHPVLLITIAKYCRMLQCIDMLVYDLASLKIISDICSKQLTCVVLYTNLRSGIGPFVYGCTNLTNVAILAPRYASYERTKDNSDELFALNPGIIPELPKSLRSVRNLIISKDCVTEETLETLALMTDIVSVRISLPHCLNRTSLWCLVLRNWENLRSLTLEVTSEGCVHFDPLPPNLEYLSLNAIGYYRDCQNRTPIHFSAELPKLKTLKISLRSLSGNQLRAVLNSGVFSSPALEELSVCIVSLTGLSEVADEELHSLLPLTSPEQMLLIGCQFSFSEVYVKVTNLAYLTLINGSTESLVPTGTTFWNTLREKSISCHSVSLNLFGQIKDMRHELGSLPPNVYLHFTSDISANMCNVYGGITEVWNDVTEELRFEQLAFKLLHGNCLNLNQLPISVEKLSIRCLSQENCPKVEWLEFHVYLPKLTSISVFQQYMSNDQLRVLAESISEHCSLVISLSLDRANEDPGYVDDHLSCLLKCRYLGCFCLSKNFSMSNEFRRTLLTSVKNLKILDCG